MEHVDHTELLEATTAAAIAYLKGMEHRPVQARGTPAELDHAFDAPLPDHGIPAEQVVTDLVATAEPGLTAMGSGRYFGYVIGGALPAALAADWLTGVWDQNAVMARATPSAMAVERTVARWLVNVLGLPTQSSVGLVTGCQMAHVTCLAAARDRVLAAHGWDVGSDGLVGAPSVRVLVGAEAHDTVHRALRLLGLGARTATVVPADEQGRMRPDALADLLSAGTGPTIVVAQAGNVNTGAVDPLDAITDVVDAARGGAPDGTWLHVDGAFGLWAAASPNTRDLVTGLERADSWATDGHKWLNVPYDAGIAICADAAAHRQAMSVHASYLPDGADGGSRDAVDWTPEFSRRARGFTVYAALRQLGRAGVADLVDRCCSHARRFAAALGEADGVEVCNDVVLNQVLVRFLADDGDHDAHTRAVIERAERDGTCLMSGTTWHGMACMRISVSNWSTTADDVDRSVAALLRAHRDG